MAIQTKTPVQRPVRAGIYKSVEATKNAVQSLRDAGFSPDALSVICSGEHADEHFGVAVQKTGLGKADHALSSSVVRELGLGAAAILGAVLLPGGAPLFVVGALGGLAIAGTLASLFATRGMDREAIDFFEQSLQEGDLLVAVEVHGDDAAQWLARAEDVLRETGAGLVSLEE